MIRCLIVLVDIDHFDDFIGLVINVHWYNHGYSWFIDLIDQLINDHDWQNEIVRLLKTHKFMLK